MKRIFLKKFFTKIIKTVTFACILFACSNSSAQQYANITFNLVEVTPGPSLCADENFCVMVPMDDQHPDPRWKFRYGHSGNISSSDIVINAGSFNDTCSVSIPINQNLNVYTFTCTNIINFEVDYWEEDCCGADDEYDTTCQIGAGGEDDDNFSTSDFEINDFLSNAQGVLVPYNFVHPSGDYSFTIEIQWDQIIPEITGDLFICPDSSATLDAGTYGATANYLWSSGETTQAITTATPGTYTITLTDIVCITISNPVSVSASTLNVDSLIVGNMISCNGFADGAATAYVSGGSVPYSFLWDNSESSATATALSAGTHEITVTDLDGCQVTSTVLISEPAILVAAIDTISTISCNGIADASIEASITGGTSPYTYLWSTTETTDTISNLGPATYQLTATDTNGCTATAEATFIDPAVLTLSLTEDSMVNCNGESNGAATATSTGGSPPYSFEWDNSETNSTASALNAGTHTATVTDTNGCTETASVIIGEPTALSATAIEDSAVLCFGESNGTATATASDGTPPYTFLWDNGETNAQATMLNAGDHTITITDGNICTTTTSVTINEPALLSASATEDAAALCFGESNGTATATTSDGTSPYTFLWDSGETDAQATMLNSGNHTITITDGNGCTTTTAVLINEPPLLTASATEDSAVLCFGESNGTATATASDGTSPYTFLWDNGETDAQATMLNAGSHMITTTDGNGCTTTSSVIINEPALLTASASEDSSVLCEGDSNGAATTTASDGIGPYTFIWDNGETNATATALNAGIHQVTVTDNNNCLTTTTVEITSAVLLTTNVTEDTAVLCNGESNGVATISAAGGTSPFTYQWDNGETDATISNLDAGTHVLTVTDSNGCSTTNSIDITEPDALVVMLIEDMPVNCFGESNGAASVISSNGVTPHTYLWENGNTTAQATGLNATMHSVTVTDMNGCTIIDSVMVNEPLQLSALATEDSPVVCNGESNGVASVMATGGISSYSYLWDNSETSATATNLNAGLHEVTITDMNGCTVTSSVNINEPTALTAVTTEDSGTLCNGQSNGVATSTPTGGSTPYSYLWDSFETTATATSLNAGTHAITITDTNGCITTSSVLISEPAALIGTATEDSSVLCNGDSNGVGTIVPSGGTAPYTYLWDNSDTNATSSNLDQGIHTVTITDSNNCLAESTVNITEPPALTASTTQVSGVLCFGESNGVANTSPSGGTGPFTFLWDNGETDAMATNFNAGNHTLTITDNNGCTVEDNLTISEPDLLEVSTAEDVSVQCFSESNGVANATGVGGTTPYNYEWDNGETNATASNLTAGSHQITLTDTNGCTQTSSVEINEPPILSGVISSPSFSGGWEISCADFSDGSATFTLDGGTEPYTYLWNDINAQQTETATGLIEGTYTVLVTDANSCSLTGSITLEEPGQFVTTAIDSSDFNNNGWAISCNGESDGSINISLTGGTGPYNYLWDDSENQTTAQATGLSAGTYGLTITDQNNCIVEESIDIHEPQQIAAAGSNIVLCEATSIVVTGNPTGGTGSYTTHEWTCDASLLNDPTIAAPTFISPIAGTYTLCYKVTDSNGCSATTNISINIDPNPAISINTSVQDVCSNEHGVPFSVFQESGVSYQWSMAPATSLITGQESICASIDFPAVTGTVDVSVIAENTFGCTSQLDIPIQVSTNSAPDTSEIILIQPSNTLVCLNNTFDSYQWGYDAEPDLCPVTLDGEIYQDYIAGTSLDLNNRYYWVITTVGNCKTKSYYNRPGRSGNFGTAWVNTGISAEIFPNPNDGNFIITLSGQEEGDFSMYLLDPLGRLVREAVLHKNIPTQKFPQAFKGLPAGMYYVRLSDNETRTQTFKIILH